MGKRGQAKKVVTSTPTKRANHRSKSREDEQDVRDARRALKEARKKGSVSWEQVKRDVGI